MDDPTRSNQGRHSKSTASEGISLREHQLLRSRVEKLEKIIQEQLSEKNQWNYMVRSWVGSRVEVTLLNGTTVIGELTWIDRYTLCLMVDNAPVVVHKGAIAIIRRKGDTTLKQPPRSSG